MSVSNCKHCVYNVKSIVFLWVSCERYATKEQPKIGARDWHHFGRKSLFSDAD